VPFLSRGLMSMAILMKQSFNNQTTITQMRLKYYI
jgi:hypothetical protein